MLPFLFAILSMTWTQNHNSQGTSKTGDLGSNTNLTPTCCDEYAVGAFWTHHSRTIYERNHQEDLVAFSKEAPNCHYNYLMSVTFKRKYCYEDTLSSFSVGVTTLESSNLGDIPNENNKPSA